MINALPTIQSLLSAPEQAVDEAVAMLTTLPMKQPVEREVLRAAFFIALDGVPAEILEMAVRAILQNSLGHPFMPAPPELRGECDRISFKVKADMLVHGAFDHFPSDEEMLQHLRGQQRRIT